jgi:threonine/homoserine/homoserine lactone efflux protein
MSLVSTFSLAFVFSFIGSIPPGTLNITMVQLGLAGKKDVAVRFAIAAALIEYLYTMLAIKFETLMTVSPVITDNLKWITGAVMILLGIFNLLSSHHENKIYQRFNESGFRRGIFLSLLNPLVLPFWIGVTAYLKSLHWIVITTSTEIQCYLLGASLGAFTLLMLMAYLSNRTGMNARMSVTIKRAPGIALLVLGLYALLQYFL